MSGLRHSHKLPGGKQFLKITILILLVCVILLGCIDQVASFIPGPGRSDWEVQLTDQYYIIKANSCSVKICRASDTPGLYENLLSNFYLTKYCVLDSFICIEGIVTEGLFATEEEQESEEWCYYLLDIRDGTLCGPYDSESILMESLIARDDITSLVWETVPQ